MHVQSGSIENYGNMLKRLLEARIHCIVAACEPEFHCQKHTTPAPWQGSPPHLGRINRPALTFHFEFCCTIKDLTPDLLRFDACPTWSLEQEVPEACQADS